MAGGAHHGAIGIGNPILEATGDFRCAKRTLLPPSSRGTIFHVCVACCVLFIFGVLVPYGRVCTFAFSLCSNLMSVLSPPLRPPPPKSRFKWNGWPEDWYICHMAANMYDELPDNLKPAPANETADFSVEMLFSEERPFGTHQYWCCLPPDAPQMRSMVEGCPEALGILPSHLLSNEKWRSMVCSLNVSRYTFDPAVNVTFDFKEVCTDG